MDTQTMIELLKKNGFTEREAKVYTILLSNPNSTPTMIHNLIGLTRPRIYEILSSLISKGMITEDLLGNKKVYKVLNPKNTFQQLLEQKEKEYEQYKSENEHLSDFIQKLYQQSSLDQSPYYQLEHLSDPVSINERIKYYWSKAEKELLIFYKHPQIISSSGNISDDVKIRTIIEFNGDQKTKILISNLIKNKGPLDEIRITDALPLKLLVVDDQFTALGFSENEPSPNKMNTLFFNEPIIAMFMREIFETRWLKAKDYSEFNWEE